MGYPCKERLHLLLPFRMPTTWQGPYIISNFYNNCWGVSVSPFTAEETKSERGGNLPQATQPEREEFGFEPKSVNYYSWLVSFHTSQRVKWVGMRQKGK